ncbi:MAG: phosphomannomutase/phosphoglucomutase [Parcubacteria group bacterium]
MEINPKIFKAYDIRGVYPEEITEDAAYKIGQAFASYAKVKSIVVGRDTRLSSPSLMDAVIKGITSQGVDVEDIGLCSTSCFYFTVGDNQEFDSGIMVTASHAPKLINGFKMVFRGNLSLTKEQILEFKDIVLKEDFQEREHEGQVIKKDPTEKYVQTIRRFIKDKILPLKVVMDPGNGTAGLYIEKVFAGIGLQIIPIFFEPDGNFPNHETNPKLPENRTKIIEKIIKEKADLGFMFDGDADRMYVLDRSGEVVDPSLILAIIGEYMVKNSTKKKVVIEVRTSKIVRDWVEKAGGKIIVSSCWTIPIKLEMKADSEIVFGGETSGHYIFPELHETDDGIFGALTFLQAISVKEKTIDEIIQKFKEEYFVLEERNFEMPDMDEADKILEKLKNKYSSEGAQILGIDGLSVVFPDWWFNIRKSQAEPVIRLNLEANSKELFEEKKAEVIASLEK